MLPVVLYETKISTIKQKGFVLLQMSSAFVRHLVDGRWFNIHVLLNMGKFPYDSSDSALGKDTRNYRSL